MAKRNAFTPMWVIFAALIAVAGFSVYQRMNPPSEIVPWRTDLAAAQADAKAQGKPLLVYFTASWCGPCQQMKKTTFADAAVEKALQAYVPVKIDVDQNPQAAAQYGVNGIPHFIHLPTDPAKAPKARTGYTPPQEFVSFLTSARGR